MSRHQLRTGAREISRGPGASPLVTIMLGDWRYAECWGGNRMNTLLKWTIIVLLLAAAPVAPAQERIARVGYLSWNDSGPYHELTIKGFVEGLRDQGYVEGRNLVILRRTAD